MSSLDSRLLWGGSTEKKVGGVTGIGLHAVSMSSLDTRLLWGVPQERKVGGVTGIDFTPFPCPALIRDFCGGPTRKKSAESPELTSRRFPHHSSAKDN
ncbi:hypothetical protein TNCV_1558661 [Trichonephila clavipes]|nr:hypothetical protein TNCV_1558661 [Trichonephila clavipes]